jgi:hypothetical protein
MCLSAYHVIMIMAFHRIRYTVCMFTYAIASYRIAGGVASSSTEEQTGTDPQELQAQEVPEERRGLARVRRSPA